MTTLLQFIPDLLVSTRGNVSELARRLDVNRITVKKYAHDKNGERHAVINGVLMTRHGKWYSNRSQNQ